MHSSVPILLSRSIKGGFCFGLLVCLGLCAKSASAEVKGPYIPEPLQMRSEAIGQLFRTSPLAQRFKLLSAGDWSVMSSRTYANFWGHDKRYIVDTESRDDRLRIDSQPFDHWAFYGVLSERAFTRMGTDGMAIGFHNMFGLPQDGRLDAPRNNTRLSIPDYDLNYSLAHKNNIISRQVEGGAVWDIGSRYDLVVPLTLGIFATHETADSNPYFTGNTDFGFRLGAALPFENTALFGTLTFTLLDPAEEVVIPTFHSQWGGVVGGAYHVAENHELVMQALIYQPMFQDMGQLSRSSYEIHLAYRYQWEDVSFELGLVENIFWVYNSPDWGLSAGLTYRPEN